MTRSRLLPLLACLPLLGGCASFGEPDARWADSQAEVLNAAVLHEAIAMALDDLGYALDGTGAPGQGMASTLWKEDRHPFQGRGVRTKATVEYELVQPEAEEEGAPRPGPYHTLRARVQVERNMSNRPLDASYDEWEAMEDDPRAAGHILAKVRAYLFGA